MSLEKNLSPQVKPTRSYRSSVRRKQAEDTRTRIADAAEELIKSNGYEHTTIGAIASRAGVAPQTVYAIFNSKQGVLIWLLRRSMFTANSEVNYKKLSHMESIAETARDIASMLSVEARKNISILNTLGGMDVLYPELAQLAKEAHLRRRESIVDGVSEALRLRSAQVTPLQKKILVDILWASTDMHFYYMLVLQSGWSNDLYELLLQKMLCSIINDVIPEILKTIND